MIKVFLILGVAVGLYAGGVIFNLVSGGIRARRFAKLGYPTPGWHMVGVIQTSWLSWLLPILDVIARRRKRQERGEKGKEVRKELKK